MKTRRIILLEIDEVRQYLIEFYEQMIKETEFDIIDGNGFVPVLLFKGIKNLTPDELVEVCSCGFIEMFLEQNNRENLKSPSIAVIMFVPNGEGLGRHKSYLLSPNTIFPNDLISH